VRVFEFVKMHGCGNDFIVIDDYSEEIVLSAEEVAALCHREFGIGADGVILVRPSKRVQGGAYMHYINSDGSLAEMCGNGVRCFAKYLVDRGFVAASSKHFVADTLAGQRPIRFEVDEDEKLSVASVAMGCPEFLPEKIPTTLLANAETKNGIPCIKEAPLASPWGDFPFTCVSMGNPHAVCFVDDFAALSNELFEAGVEKNLENLNLARVGSYFEKHPAFPQKANIEFACVGTNGISVRTFERGCGETLACGTGACATAAAAILTKRANREVDIILRGGTLHILMDENDHITMTGPATEVFSGSIEIDQLAL